MKQLGAALLGALLLGGCVSTVTDGLEVVVREGGVAQVTTESALFHSRAGIEETFARRTPGGFLEAKVRVRNRHGRDWPVQYKFVWFDADGMEVQPGGRVWEQTVLHGGETVTLAAVAPEQSVVKYACRIRRAKLSTGE